MIWGDREFLAVTLEWRGHSRQVYQRQNMRATNKSRSRNKNNNRSRNNSGNVVNRVFDSNGPEGRVRGTPAQIIEKYQMLMNDASLSGDRVAAENFSQHAEHYIRLLAAAQEEQNRIQAERQAEYEARQKSRNQERNQDDVEPSANGYDDGETGPIEQGEREADERREGERNEREQPAYEHRGKSRRGPAVIEDPRDADNADDAANDDAPKKSTSRKRSPRRKSSEVDGAAGFDEDSTPGFLNLAIND